MKKKIIVAGVILALLIVCFVGVAIGTRQETAEGSKSISVEVVHSDESSKNFDYKTDAEYLGDALLDEGLIKGDESEYGLYVTEVDGETASWDDDGAYWAFYVNGEYAMQGVDSTPVEDGDSFSFVYEIG